MDFEKSTSLETELAELFENDKKITIKKNKKNNKNIKKDIIKKDVIKKDVLNNDDNGSKTNESDINLDDDCWTIIDGFFSNQKNTQINPSAHLTTSGGRILCPEP